MQDQAKSLEQSMPQPLSEIEVTLDGNNSNSVAQAYLENITAIEPKMPLAYSSALFSSQLNYSVGSLQRVDRLLNQMKAFSKEDFKSLQDTIGIDSVQNNASNSPNENFVLTLGFYIGEMAAKSKRSEATWLTPDQFALLYPEQPPLKYDIAHRYVAVIDDQLVKPLAFVIKSLFHEQEMTLSQFIHMSLNDEYANKLSVSLQKHEQEIEAQFDMPDGALEGDILNEIENLTPIPTSSLVHGRVVESLNMINSQETPVVDDSDTMELSDIPELTDTQPIQGSVKEVPQKKQQDAFREVVTQTSDDVPAVSAFPSSSEAQSNTHTLNSKLRAIFKPAILPYILISLPFMAVVLYQIYKMFTVANSVTTTGMIITGIFLLGLMAVWANFVMHKVQVFDNKVTVSSLIKNAQAVFDEQTAFFHIPASTNNWLAKTVAPERIKITTATDTLEVTAGQYDQLETALLDAETELLYDRMLARLNNHETLYFGQLQMTKDMLIYGNKGMAIKRMGDYDIVGSEFVIHDVDGQLFARMPLSAQPNLNTFVTLVEHFS